MKMYVSSYNNGTTSWNNVDGSGFPNSEETAFLDYHLTHRFNEPTEAEIILSDPTGTLAQKYNADANDVYIGAGKVTIEDPTATKIFYGRIIRAEVDTASRELRLFCQDWLSQLDDEQIDYDMREDLDGSGLRQSEIKSDVGDETLPVSQTFMYAVADDGGVQTTETTAANDDTADDMTLLPADPAVPAVNDAYYFGFDTEIFQFQLDISTAGSWVGTLTWEAWIADGMEAPAWVDITSELTDGTSSFETAGENTISWALTGAWDWETTAVNGITKYWIRARVSAYTSITTYPTGKQAWVPQILYDDDMTFDADEWNGKYLIFPNENVGTIDIETGPYADTVAGTETAGSYADVWADDTNFHDLTRSGSSLTVDYDFHINAEMGSLYSSGPSAGKITLAYICYNDTQDMHMRVKVKSAAEAYYTILQVDNTTSTTAIRRTSVTIPTQYLAGFLDTAGEVTIQIEAECAVAPANVYLDVYQCLVELTYTLTGTSSAYDITDTLPNEIHTVANLTYNGLGLWEGAKYCVAQEIYKHIDSAESGTLITAGDTMVELTCAATIEHTSGISTRSYLEMTRYAILKDLAIQDAASFWMALGTTTLNWKKTWSDAVADETLTDADVNSWKTEYDWLKVFNKATVHGMRIGDEELVQTYTDTTSTAKFKSTRTKIVRESGIVSSYDALTRATAEVAQLADPQWVITATIRGNTATAAHPKTIVLGDEIQITSTYLGLTTAWYVVQRWEYNSKSHLTTLLLHPRVSTGLVTEDFTSAEIAKSNIKRGVVDRYIPKPPSDVIT